MNIRLLNIQIKKLLNLNSLFNLVLIVFMLVLIFSPPAKALLIRGLMKIGLFQPSIPLNQNSINVPTDIIFKDSNGKSVTLSSLKDKVVFINFWATWCPPCIAELPSINELYTKLKTTHNIVFLIVDTDGDFSKSLPFITKHGYQVPIYIATTSIPASMLGNAIPATAILNKQGKIVFHHDGAANYTNAKFMAFLEKLSNE